MERTEDNRLSNAERAAELYAELLEAHRQLPDVGCAYRRLNAVFQTCLNEKASFAGVRFGGSFAKTDYLLKEHGAPIQLQRAVNDARVRLRKQRSLAQTELAPSFPYDLKAISRFISLVYGEPVPDALEALFPADRAWQRAAVTAECLRVIVNRWDDTFLYATADMAGADELTVFYGGTSPTATYKDWDWSYLRPLLRQGCQLNLVRPRIHDGVLYPELIIWEPDCLVDISAVAACFESYAVTPLIHLLNKLRPTQNSQPIVLGHLASQFLDESLYDTASEGTYQQSVATFFRQHAMALLTTELSADFHAQARRQQQIIRRTVHQTLPRLLQTDGLRFDATEMMVEPTFFSEMLGLQGRMDFMHLGQQLLIEQKSGKAGFPETNPPRQQQKHYVQLLLYMLLMRYNFRATYDHNDHRLYAFLFYSKYQDGLLSLGFAPDLIFQAVSMRNRLAAAEYGYSRDGFGLLTSLTANALNEQQTATTLWERYQKPEIEHLLQPIREASALERAYYLRFLQFIETEHLMAKVGNQTKENSGFADKWHSSLDDKRLAGNIYYGLRLVSPDTGTAGRVSRVELAFTDPSLQEVSNFRVGDIVVFYPYGEGEEPDVRRTMVFRATIERIGADRLVLNLRAAQTSASVFWYGGRQRWAVEHDFFESSFAPLYRGMHAFLSAPKERRDLLLLQREPRTDASLTLQGDYGAFNELALRVRQARDLFLIIGPPGTGKTSYGLLNTLLEELRATDGAVLLLSYTNRAVDEICSKLVEQHIDFMRMGSPFSCDEAYRPWLFDERVAQCSKVSQLQALIDCTRVFVGTTTAFNSNVAFFRLKHFSLAIIDEASQILEPHLMGILSATTDDGRPAVERFVMIGDHKQLPAVVQQRAEESAVSDEQLRAVHLTDCRLSLFERLLRRYAGRPDVVYMLTRQGRMHPGVALFPNRAFYEGRLQEVPLPHQLDVLPHDVDTPDALDRLLATQRLAFVTVEPTDESASDKVNTSEARAIAATAAHIYRLHSATFDPATTLGIIVPYRNQIAEVRRWLLTYGINALQSVSIDTVERYQGSQRDYIIYGFTIQKYYQLNFLTDSVFSENGTLIDRKLNVAMTRARKHLIIFGNPRLLSRNAIFARLMDFCRRHDCYYNASNLLSTSSAKR